MLKAKMPLIILLALLIMSGFITFKFYANNKGLVDENIALKKEKEQLGNDNRNLFSKYKDLEKKYRIADGRLKNIQKELSNLEKEKEDLQSKYDVVSQQRETLVKKVKELKEAGRTAARPVRREEKKEPEVTGEYWADILREKADLQTMLENLRNEIIDSKTNIVGLEKENKELSLSIDQLTKDKEKLEMEMSFKERSMEIMSRDLVSEREARKRVANELDRLRDDNVELKRELIVANKDRLNLQKKIKEEFQSKEKLEKTVNEIENILREKTLIFSELEGQLTKAVRGKEALLTEDSASVELPPIVVKSDTSVRSIRGEILAVNKNDNFVIIDLGEDAGVKPGLRFEILRGDNAVGNIEIIETRREISAADIKEVYSNYSVREGDTVIVK